jgi:hypothetical protein
MSQKSQTTRLGVLLAACAIPSMLEAAAVVWGVCHGMTGKALRDGLDFWAGGFLALHGQAQMLFDPVAYQGFLSGLYGHNLPEHVWSYPPNYLLLTAAFGGLGPWQAVLLFDALALVLLALVLRLAGQSWWFAGAVLAAPACLETVLEHQNAVLMTALIGGGLLLLPTRPRLGGVLVGLASIKPQLGLVLPVYLLRRAPVAVMYATLAALMLGVAALFAFGPGAWSGFWTVTRPFMDAVLLTGKPADFAGGLVSVFALARPLGTHLALGMQGAVTAAAVLAGWRARTPAVVLILGALASPYLHDYDLAGVALAVALLVQERLENGFAPGEKALFFVAWFGPGLLPWMPHLAHAVPVVLGLLLASAWRRGGVGACDLSQDPPVLPGYSAGPLPTPARPESTAPG